MVSLYSRLHWDFRQAMVTRYDNNSVTVPPFLAAFKEAWEYLDIVLGNESEVN